MFHMKCFFTVLFSFCKRISDFFFQFVHFCESCWVLLSSGYCSLDKIEYNVEYDTYVTPYWNAGYCRLVYILSNFADKMRLAVVIRILGCTRPSHSNICHHHDQSITRIFFLTLVFGQYILFQWLFQHNVIVHSEIVKLL